MKLEDPLKGKCKHGIPKKDRCDKCWDILINNYRKQTEKILKDLAKAEKRARKCNLQFD